MKLGEQVCIQLDGRQVNAGTVVVVNISGVGGKNGQTGKNVVTTLGELRIDFGQDAKAPAWPALELSRINGSNLSDDRKMDEIAKIMAAHEVAVDAFRVKGNAPIADRVATAVVDFLVQNHGMSRGDKNKDLNINENMLTVTTLLGNNGQVLFQVAAAPEWGV